MQISTNYNSLHDAQEKLIKKDFDLASITFLILKNLSVHCNNRYAISIHSVRVVVSDNNSNNNNSNEF